MYDNRLSLDQTENVLRIRMSAGKHHRKNKDFLAGLELLNICISRCKYQSVCIVESKARAG